MAIFYFLSDIHVKPQSKFGLFKLLKSSKKLPKQDLRRVLAKLESLTIDPFPDGCRKLEIEPNAFRVRICIYGLIHDVIGDELTVTVLKIVHRKNAYR